MLLLAYLVAVVCAVPREVSRSDIPKTHVLFAVVERNRTYDTHAHCLCLY